MTLCSNNTAPAIQHLCFNFGLPPKWTNNSGMIVVGSSEWAVCVQCQCGRVGDKDILASMTTRLNSEKYHYQTITAIYCFTNCHQNIINLKAVYQANFVLMSDTIYAMLFHYPTNVTKYFVGIVISTLCCNLCKCHNLFCITYDIMNVIFSDHILLVVFFHVPGSPVSYIIR